MSPRIKTRSNAHTYGLLRFASLYLGWLGKNTSQRHSIAPGLPPEKANEIAASYVVCLAVTIMVCMLLPVEIYLGSLGAILLLSGLLALCLASFLFISVTNKTMLPLLGMALYVFIICAYFLFTGVVNEDSLLYYFWVIPVMVGCLGTRLATALSFVFIGMMTVLFLPPVHALMVTQIDPGFRFRFILALFCLYLVSALAEHYLHSMFQAIFAMHRELEQHSLTDSLTGQGNRRNFINQFQRLHALQLRSSEPFTIVMADLDHFKAVNDTYGHMVGDEVLVFVSDILSKTLRRQDSLYRWGGEEFIILLPDTAQEQGKVAAERMRSAIEGDIFAKDSTRIKITASFGVYTVGTAQPMHEHLKNTDTLLYQAKAAGRNCVVAADDGSGMILAVN